MPIDFTYISMSISISDQRGVGVFRVKCKSKNLNNFVLILFWQRLLCQLKSINSMYATGHSVDWSGGWTLRENFSTLHTDRTYTNKTHETLSLKWMRDRTGAKGESTENFRIKRWLPLLLLQTTCSSGF